MLKKKSEEPNIPKVTYIEKDAENYVSLPLVTGNRKVLGCEN
jgi:hypothetical protein